MRQCFVGWLLWLGVYAGLPVCLAFAHPVELNPAEQAFVHDHPSVRICVNPDWAPFEWIAADGTHRGIAADLAHLAARRVGLTLDLVRTADWRESLVAAKAGRCQVLNFLNQTDERDAWLVFTDPIFSDPNVFITREEHPFISDPARQTGKPLSFRFVPR